MPDIKLARARAVHDLPITQLASLQRKVPLLYVLVTVNAIALALVFRNLAPHVLTLYVPAALIIPGLVRMFYWLKIANRPLPDANTARIRLRRTSLVASLFTVAYLAWVLALDHFSTPTIHGQVMVFVALTLLGAVACLGYLIHTAHAVSLIVLATFVVHELVAGHTEFLALIVSMVVTVLFMLMAVRGSFDAFFELEASKNTLKLRQEVTEQLNEENRRLAHSDMLTGLPNRRFFFARLEEMLMRAEHVPFCVGVLDLDGFKPVNDTFGHANGDRLLASIGSRLRELANHEGAIFARLGGDEFGLIVDGDEERARTVAAMMAAQIRRQVRLGEVRVSLGCSCGLASYPAGGDTANLLFDHADFALYYAKRHKRGACVHFSADFAQMIRSEQAIDMALQTADLDAELYLAFQPIVQPRDLRPIGVEALARWRSPVVGTVAPEVLIAGAERTGRAHSVTLTLFAKAVEALLRLPPPARLSFNLSATDLADPETLEALLRHMGALGADAARLVFEITETSLISDFASAKAGLERLRAGGAGVALDDFGTGYSSLSSLHQLPIDTLKIDRSFSARLHDVKGRRLLVAIRDLARSLSVDCVIEGIETELQLIEAGLADFTYVQGFYIARPGSLDEIIAHHFAPQRLRTSNAA